MNEDEEFNSKNWVWVPDEEETFIKGYVIDYLDDHSCKVISKKNNQEITKVYSTKEINNCNPNKFNKCNDMAELTHLNEPSVIYNLYLRYMDNLIYTYSGLFLVAINPYKTLPIYNTQSQDFGRPHIFSIAKSTHNNLMSNNKDQSILVTGESGAGKTENTKKIIQFLSSISANESIDEKILQTNPILEAFGNAKTIKNNNSSRFGKFIKLYFNKTNLIGANINYYLLEKSRVINQQEGERNYHIFYQFLKSYKHLDRFYLTNEISQYKYLQNDKSDLNDQEEFGNLLESFKIIGLADTDVDNIFNVLAVILHLGNIDFLNWKSDQANFHSKAPIKQVLTLLNVDKSTFETNLLRPKVKAGREFISKSKKPNEVKYLIDSLSKFLYEFLFSFIINKINENLNLNFNKKNSDDLDANFIGVLDIAGFEIFKINSFEQLCINFTNEKLQQFFNHHSFILEQSEYLKEDIKWDYIDFGKDLQPTIDLIENFKAPNLGILKHLDEECIIPNSSDKSFLDKLFTSFKKNPKFKPNKFKSGFIVNHYAGEVEYNVDNWLNKNNDPLNDSLVTLLKNCKNQFIISSVENLVSNKKSLSVKYKQELNDLMEDLNNTEPHFVRCILPNLLKKPNKFDKNLVLNQLRCNGVLEGIRITRAGYPNKMVFQEFFSRYAILSSKEVFTKNYKANCELILKSIDLNLESYKIGITKIFFKNGILGHLEELRDLAIKSIFQSFQSIVRGNLSRKVFKHKINQIQSGQIIARNFVKINSFKLNHKKQGNLWYNLFIHLKPLLEDSIKVLNSQEMNENLKQINLKLKDSEKLNKNYELENNKLTALLKSLQSKYDENLKLINEKESILQDLKKDGKSSVEKVNALESKLKSLEKDNSILMTEKNDLLEKIESLDSRCQELTRKFDDLSNKHKELKENSNNDTKTFKELSENFELEKSNHGKSIELLQKQQTKIETLKSDNKSMAHELKDYQSSNDELTKKLDELVENHNTLKDKHDELSKVYQLLINNNDEKISDLTRSIGTYEKSASKHDSELKTLNKQLDQLKSENDNLINKLNESNSELLMIKKELLDAVKNGKKLDAEIERLSSLKNDVSDLKAKESNQLKQIETLTKQLAKSNKVNDDYLSKISNLKDEYSSKIIDLNDKINQLEADNKNYEREKENQPPPFQQSMMNDYSNLKLKLNEVTANLRTEKFENKKLVEEISILRSKVHVSPYSSPNKNRRSIAMGENPNSEGNNLLMKQIEDLKLKLEQEESNSLRAENYAIELQKKLNKLQNTRGTNSSIDFEKRYKESQLRVSELENKFGKLFESSSPNNSYSSHDSNDISPSLNPLTKSESFGRSSIINKSLESANQDFVKIYHDITKTLKATREELTTSKSEILRLKSLLRESEDELYQVKRDNHKVSIENYETEIAHLKVKQDNLLSRNEDLHKSLDLYKKRSDEYFQKLDLAETAVTISKRHEENATKELNDIKTEYKLIKEELKACEILIKDNNKEKTNLQNELKDKDHKIGKLLEEIKELNDKLIYNKKIYENKEVNEKLKSEIQSLNNDLNFKLNNESKLIKENKQLTIDNETLIKQKQNLEQDYEVKLDKIDELELKNDEMAKRVRVLENEKSINERKINNLTKQVNNLKELINDITLQRDELIEIKDTLEEKNLVLTQTLEDKELEINSKASDINILRNHLENQRLESLEIQQELNQSKLSNNDDITNYSKLKRENLVIIQENDALARINNELKSKVDNLENKLYNDEQIKYWENKLNEMNMKIDNSKTENYNLTKLIQQKDQEIKTYKIKFDNDSKLVKKYNDENFDYQNKINHFKSSIDILQSENLDKDLKLKTMERDNSEFRENMLRLEREVLQLRSKLGIE